MNNAHFQSFSILLKNKNAPYSQGHILLNLVLGLNFFFSCVDHNLSSVIQFSFMPMGSVEKM